MLARSPKTKEWPTVPIEYSGLWVAWDHKNKKIIASARTFAEVRKAAAEAGEIETSFMKVPRADARLVGGIA